MLIIRQIDWREVGWPLSCNVFAIARFLVGIFRVQETCLMIADVVLPLVSDHFKVEKEMEKGRKGGVRKGSKGTGENTSSEINF